MTFARVYGTGSGALRFRLSIEGWPYEFVTSSSMATTAADGRVRVVGLSVEGAKITQRADLVRSTLEAQGMSVKIADVAVKATLAFSLQPTYTTWLASVAAASASTVNVQSTSGWPATGYFHVDTEAFSYTGKTGTSFTGCTGARWDTVAQAHYVPDGGQLRYPQITSTPVVMEGRRARLYVYGAGDSATGDGTQIFLGVVSGEPKMRGPSWTVSIDPISRILSQEVGADLGDPVAPRGIYYPGVYDGSWFLVIGRTAGTGALFSDRTLAAARTYVSFPYTNASTNAPFFETQQDFIDAVNTQLATATSGYNVTIKCKPSGDGRYYFEIAQGATVDSLYLALGTPSYDSYFETNLLSPSEDGPPGPLTGTLAGNMVANTRYFWFPTPNASKLDQAGLVPRGMFSTSLERSLSTGESGGSDASPKNRIYLSGLTTVTSNMTSVLADWQDEGGGGEAIAYRVDTSVAGSRYVELLRDAGGTDAEDAHYWTPANLPQLRLGRSYSRSGGGSVSDFLSALITNAPTQVNIGSQPMIQSTPGPVAAPGDIDQTAFSAAVSTSATSIATDRSFSSFASASLEEMIAPELQLLGHFLTFDSFGRLSTKRLRLAAATEVGTFTITKANLLTDDGFPQYERSAIGKFSTLIIRDGYDPVEDDYTLPSITVRDVSSFGQTPNSRTITIEPKSRYVSGRAMALEDVMRVASNALGIFGGPYAMITLAVPLTGFYSVDLGSTVSMTTVQLPSTTGTRGMSGTVGLVVAREVDLYGARIDLTVLVSLANVAGYAPSAKVSSQTNSSGNTWAIVLSSSYFAAGETAANHFVAGELVRIFEYDSASSTEIGGTVVSASSYTVVVTFASTWTPSTLEWVLGFAKSTAIATASRQLSYAFDGTSSASYADSLSVTYPAREFAP